jgi:hypothetical protein
VKPAARLQVDHAAMRRVELPLKRTAMAISLDRINGPVLLQRVRIAAQRILGDLPEPGVLRGYHVLIAPLLEAPKAMVHNSMSPLNVVAGVDGWRAIDWETLTLASPMWDWAEMLRAPYNPLTFAESERLMLSATGLGDDGKDIFRRAVLSRHIDSLATVVQRRRLYAAEDRSDRAAEYARRAAFYAQDLHDLSGRLEISPRLSEWLAALRESALT